MSINAARNAQVFRPIQSTRNRFEGETPKQIALHREIDREYQRKRQCIPRFINIRKHELQLLFAERYRGGRLPYDDAGRDDLRLMFDHLAQRGPDFCRAWARTWMPDMPDDELNALIDDAGEGKRWTPVPLGKALRLTNVERIRLDIRTIRPIDRTKAQLDQDRRERHAETEAKRRLDAGAKPRALSEARLKPWLALGESESTYRRRKRQNQNRDSNSCAILLESQCGTMAEKERRLISQRTRDARTSGPISSLVVSG